MIRFFARLKDWWSRGPLPSPVFADDTVLTQLESFTPAGFVSGVQILNDSTTPMEAVVELLMQEMGLLKDHAVKVMLEIHLKGGVLLPTASGAEASERAQALSRAAVDRNLSLRVTAIGTDV